MSAASPPAHADFSLAERLADLPYFKALSPERVAALAQQAACHTFEPQEPIFWEGDASAGLWLIEKGRAKIYKLSPEGREHVLHLLGPGDSFNDIAALDGGPNPASAVALSDVTAWTLPSHALLAELHADPDLALAVIGILTGRVRALVDQIEALALYSVTARLARFLLNQLDNASLSGPGITRAIIAAHLATTPETVSRALRTLEDIGAIRFDRHAILIVRPDLLKSLASS
jgi:CRP/FNR family transcriptional regulator